MAVGRQLRPRGHSTVFAALTIVATVFSGGCASSLRQWAHNGFKVGPNYCKPAAPVESQWIDYQKDPRVSADQVDTSCWWATFNDPKLENLMHLASRQNLTLRAAGARILQAQALRGYTAGNLLPQVQQLSADYNRVQISSNVANPPDSTHYDDWSTGFNLSWEIDFWGRYRRAIEAADSTLDASIEDYDDVLVILLSETAASYTQIRTYQERLRLALENVKSQEKTRDVAQVRFENKVISKLDVLQVEDNVARTEALVQYLKFGLRQQNNALCVLLGMPPHDLTQDPLVGDGPIPSAEPQVAVGIPCDLLRRRPDVRRAERRAAAQSARIGIAESELYPHFAINGVLQWQSDDFSNLIGPDSTAGAIGPGFSWNILNYGRLRNLVRNEEARFAELVYAYQQTVLNAAAEAEDGIVGFLTSQDREAQLRHAVKILVEADRLALLEAEEVRRDYNRVYVMQWQQSVREDEWAVSKGDIALSLIRIYRALGGGWQIRLADSDPGLLPPEPVMATAESAGPTKVAKKRMAPINSVMRTAKSLKAQLMK